MIGGLCGCDWLSVVCGKLVCLRLAFCCIWKVCLCVLRLVVCVFTIDGLCVCDWLSVVCGKSIVLLR